MMDIISVSELRDKTQEELARMLAMGYTGTNYIKIMQVYSEKKRQQEKNKK